MVRRSRATVVWATLTAVLVVNLELCGAQSLQADGPPPECIPRCTEDGKWGIPCDGYCEWYVECKDGRASTPIKCSTSWFRQMYFDNTQHECRLSNFWNSVDCNWWMALTTAAPPITPSPSTSSSSATTTTSTTTTNPDTTDQTSIIPSRVTSNTSQLTTIPTSNPPSNSSESTTPTTTSESTTPTTTSESTAPTTSESTTAKSDKPTVPAGRTSTAKPRTTPPPPTPDSADRASVAVITFILAVGLAVL